MEEEKDFGTFAETVYALGTLTKLESAISAAIRTSKIPYRETRKFMKCSTVEEASNTALFQFICLLFKQIGLGTLQLSKNDIFRYNFVIPDSTVCRLYPTITDKKVCYITAEALQQFFERDLGIPGNAEEIRCRNAGSGTCEFSVMLQPLAVYQHALDDNDKEIISAMMSKSPLKALASNLDTNEEDIKHRLGVLQRYHILDDDYSVTEIGETYQKYGQGIQVEEEDFPPPWKDMSEISSAISASTSFAEAFVETTNEEPLLEDVGDREIINLAEEAKKSTGFAELIAKLSKKEDIS